MVWASYDQWLSSPYTDVVEGPRCPTCDYEMEWEEDGDEDGPYISSWCVNKDCEESE